jgi:di/tricarboxylate transporter
VETEQLLSGYKEKLAIGGFFAVIVLSALGWVSLFKGLVLLLGLLLLTGSLNANEVMQRLPRQIWLIIGSALVLSQALTTSGALNGLKEWIVLHHDSFTPLMGLMVIYVCTWFLTELVTNNAAAALMFPIGLSLSYSLGVDPKAFLLTVAFGASASFMSPYGYQTNLMVYSAGGYRLGDFVKVGLPISLIYGITVVGMLNLFYL